MNKIYFYIVCLLLINSVSYAAITGSSGDVANGQTVVLTGSGFGTKSTAAPIRFDTFEGMTVGNSIGTEAGWLESSTNDMLISDQNQVNAFSSRNTVAEVSRPDDTADTAWLNDLGFATTGKVYINLWLRMNYGTNEVSYSQVKTWRVDVSYDGEIIYPATAQLHWSYADFPDPGGYTRAYYQHYYGLTGACDGSSVNSYEQNNNYNNIEDSTPLWVNVTFQQEQGDAETANGEILYTSYKLNGSGDIKSYINSNIMIRCNADYMDGILLQNYIGTGALATTLYYDNIYIDNSFSRVELGDDPVYADCDKREIQIPSAWSPGGDEITVEINQGVFASGETAYFFVINDGVPSAGFEVAIAAGTAPQLTCQANDTTSSTSYPFTATYTLEGARTEGPCTWESDQGPSGTCTATGGNITGTATGLTGTDVITVGLTDSAAEEGTCNFTLTYTPPAGSGTTQMSLTGTSEVSEAGTTTIQ